MKYYSQYRNHDLFELQHSLSGLSKSNRWVKLADNLPWDKIEKEYNNRLRKVKPYKETPINNKNKHCKSLYIKTV